MADVKELAINATKFNSEFLKLFTEFASPYDVHKEEFGTIKGTVSRCSRLLDDGYLEKQKIDGKIKFKWTGKEYKSRYDSKVLGSNELRISQAVDINNKFLSYFEDWTSAKGFKHSGFGAVLERCYRLEEEGCLIKKKIGRVAYFKKTGKEYYRKVESGRPTDLRTRQDFPEHKFASNDKYWAEKYKEQQRLISAERRGVKTNNYVSGSTLNMLE